MRYRLLLTALVLQFCAAAGAGLNGQCEGNLGDNIFTNGDFGSGSAAVLQSDPGIAPGFTYLRSPPPQDGFYTITNNMAAWPGVFGNWDTFRDNSSDPDGYMMVVNAAFEPGVFYERNVTGLCGNTEYQVSLDVRNVIAQGGGFIFPNVSFLLNGNEQGNTGNVPQNRQWNNYVFSFTTAADQTEATLTLRNNAPGGLGNDLAIDNIEFRACGPEAMVEGLERVSVCQGGGVLTLVSEIIGDQYGANPAFQWQESNDGGDTWEDLPGESQPTYDHAERPAGLYYYRYRLAASPANIANGKCRVLSNVKIVTVTPQLFVGVDTVCQGLPYVVGDSAYLTGGLIVDTLTSSLGCDSIINLTLTVVPDTDLDALFTTTAPTCSYTEDGTIRLDSVAGGAAPIRFFFNDTLARGPLTVGLPGGKYGYRVVDRYGCSESDSVALTAPPPLIIDLGPDQTVNLGEEVVIGLQTVGLLTSIESIPPGLVDFSQGEREARLLLPNSLNLRLLAQDTFGCVATDSVMIDVIKIRSVFIPNAFSPNGDGVNDVFTVFSDGRRIQTVSYLRIFNRWGSLVYDSEGNLVNDLSTGWDGRVGDGRLADAGAYTYLTEIVFVDGVTRQFAGTINLIY